MAVTLVAAESQYLEANQRNVSREERQRYKLASRKASG